MDNKNILNTDYLDIIFKGKNKKYGGYELRKKYSGRMLLGGLISIAVVGGIFAATLYEPKGKPVEDEIVDFDKTVAMAEPPPLKPDAPPPPPPKSPPPPVKPTVKFTPPVIKKNEEVRKEDKIDKEEIKKENKALSFETRKGDESKDAVDPNDLSRGGNGDGPAEQRQVEQPDDNTIYTQVEQMAKYNGGDIRAYLNKNIRYPAQAAEEGITGTVVLKFVVDKSGNISQIKAVKSVGGGCTEEAIRVLKTTSGNWSPAKKNGQNVRSWFQATVTFKLT